MNLDEQSYRRLIERLARERAGETVLNGSFSHASIINECMFASAGDSLDVLACNFNKEIFGTESFIRAFKKCAENRVKVRILFENAKISELPHHPLFEHFKSHPNIEMKVLPQDIADTITCNYTIMDKDSYRFERDKNKPIAVATFGDVEGFSDELCAHFKTVWSYGNSYSVH